MAQPFWKSSFLENFSISRTEDGIIGQVRLFQQGFVMNGDHILEDWQLYMDKNDNKWVCRAQKEQ